MTVFWVLGISLALLVLLATVLPLWTRRDHHNRLSQEAVNTRIFRERLQELDTERAEGHIDERQYEQLRMELERTLLDDIAEGEASAQASGGRWWASALTLVILCGALVYYYQTAYRGDTDAWMQTQAEWAPVVDYAIRQPHNDLPEIAYTNLLDFTRVLQLRALREGMREPDSLFLLGTSFMQLNAYETAQIILEQAQQYAPDRVDILLARAQASIMDNNGRLTDTSRHQLEVVLQRRPEHRGALMLLGFAAYNSGEYARAAQAWRQLYDQVPADSEVAELIANNIAQAESMLERSTSEPDDSANAAASINVTVDLAPELYERITPEDTLFIFARPASGPLMPLAAVQHSASEFPVSVVLNDGQAVLPDLKLSDFSDVVVSARISRSGQATASAGDLEGNSDPLDTRNGPLSVQITVDQIVQ